MTQPTYEVRVAGLVPADLLAEMPGLTITVQPPETVMQGSLPDQSAVVGLIIRIHGLGLRLIEVRRLAAGEVPIPRDQGALVVPGRSGSEIPSGRGGGT